VIVEGEEIFDAFVVFDMVLRTSVLKEEKIKTRLRRKN
jgi:hypothetical protein